MIDKSVPFIVRRARLLLGMTHTEFAALYGVKEAAVSQWERGLAHPSPPIWVRLRTITLRASSFLDEDLVRASPLYKFIVVMEDLTCPIVASKGIIEAIEAVGAAREIDQPFDIAELARKSPHYEVSGTRALEIIQSDPGWQDGDIVYAEVHCLSPVLGVWIDGIIAPLPDRAAALIEFTPSKRGPDDSFRVHLVGLQDMPFNQPKCLGK
jgi:transcriptional regulator with XRE-family HTH domain